MPAARRPFDAPVFMKLLSAALFLFVNPGQALGRALPEAAAENSRDPAGAAEASWAADSFSLGHQFFPVTGEDDYFIVETGPRGRYALLKRHRWIEKPRRGSPSKAAADSRGQKKPRDLLPAERLSGGAPEGEETMLILLDLKTGKKSGFLKTSSLFHEIISGFAKDGSKIWGLPSESGALMVRSLTDGAETEIPLLKNGAQKHALRAKLMEDGWTLRIFAASLSGIPGIFASMGDRKLSVDDLKGLASRHSEGGDRGIFYEISLKTMRKAKEITINMGDKLCHAIDDSMSRLFFVSRDGSLHQISLAEGGGRQTELFGPVEGFDWLSPEAFPGRPAPQRYLQKEASSEMPWPEQIKSLISAPYKCAMSPDGSYALMLDPRQRGFLLRSIPDRREFVLPFDVFPEPLAETETDEGVMRNFLDPKAMRALFGRSAAPAEGGASKGRPASGGEGRPAPPQRGRRLIFELFQHIDYPFIGAFHSGGGPSDEREADNRESRWNIYHIPSGRQARISPEKKFAIGKGGSFAFELFSEKGERIFQALAHPYDPARRAALFQRPAEDICAFGFSKDRTLAFAAAEPGGGFFVFDTKQGRMARSFVKDCPYHIKHVSGRSFVFHIWDEEAREPKLELKIFEELRPLPGPETSSLDEAEAALHDMTEAREPLTEKTLPFLTAALEGGLESRRPQLIAKSLWSALLRSPDLYLDLLSRRPHLTDLSSRGGIAAAALPPASYEDLQPYLSAALSLLKLTASETRRARLSDYGFLRPLLPLLKILPPNESALYREKITVSLTNEAARSIPLLSDVFQSKLYYAARGHVDELFGLPREIVSDITLARTEPPPPVAGPAARAYHERQGFRPVFTEAFRLNREFSEAEHDGPAPALPPAKKTVEDKWGKPLGSIKAVILASDPIEGVPGAQATDFGIHYAVAEEASREVFYQSAEPGEILLNEAVEWRISGGSSYRAKILARVKEEGLRFAALSSGPDYEAVWADGRMAGAMAVGSSLRARSRQLLKEYYSYFRERGFVFSSFETRDLKRFLLEKIAGCGIDYFLKESHSDGDERNVFRLMQNSRILHGRLPMGNGQSEEIYLIFPKIKAKKKYDPRGESGSDSALDRARRRDSSRKKSAGSEERKSSALLSNAELGEAVAQREARQCGEITYFNTSCWAHVKARYEVEAVNSPAFINIPAISYSDTFQNHRDSAIRALLDSYRAGRNFEGFREALMGLSKAGVNRYIFPDELLYQEEILARIQVPLDIDIVLERQTEAGGDWIAIAPDEAL